MSRLLLDTNYLVDFMFPDRPESECAVELFREIIQGRHEGIVSSTSLKDLYYLTRKELSDEEARDWICVFIRALDVEACDVEVCTIALESDEPDFEDGCIRAIAERAQVDFIITRDADAFARSWVKPYSAQRFLELFPAC